MREEHAQHRAGMGRPHGNDAVHALVTARLEHHRAAQVIVVLARIPPLREHGLARERRVAARDDPHRLARRVHVDVGEDDRAGHGIPISRNVGARLSLRRA